ncbi:DUF4314 domain-containing protein [Streptomyces sp. NPDC058084]|uniref:DUF4314 domain-containing protein n=1 Tax=Streptomyces sp. NPDC058084 TaxID=3346333 RepID=UPI0036EEA240
MSNSAPYMQGDRVRLVRTADEHTGLQAGDQGTVHAYHPAGPIGGRMLDVTWDSGSTLSMLLDEGDAVRKL